MSVRIATWDLPADGAIDGLAQALDAVPGERVRRVAVFAKLDGDYAESNRVRDEVRERIRAALDARGLLPRSQVLLAVGCEGVATPFGYLLVEAEGGNTDASGPARLAIGLGASPPVVADPADGLALIDHAAAAVRAAIADAGLAAHAVSMVFIKAPAPRGTRMPDGSIPGRWARAVGALGIGVALGEIDRARLTPASIARDLTLYTRRGMTYSGPELDRFEVVAMGNRPGAGGDLVACGALTADLIDARAMRRMLADAGIAFDALGELAEPGRVAAFFLKAGVPDDGVVRGGRTVVHASPITPEKHMRAAASGVLGGLLGTTRFFISGDPVQQAPEGGGVAAAVVRV